MLDALKSQYPAFGDKLFTRSHGLRIDHFLLSPELSDRLKAAGVDRHVRGWEKTSDHAPVVVTFEYLVS